MRFEFLSHYISHHFSLKYMGLEIKQRGLLSCYISEWRGHIPVIMGKVSDVSLVLRWLTWVPATCYRCIGLCCEVCGWWKQKSQAVAANLANSAVEKGIEDRNSEEIKMRIDSHPTFLAFWSGQDTWITPDTLAAIQRIFLPEDLMPLLQKQFFNEDASLFSHISRRKKHGPSLAMQKSMTLLKA